MMVGAATKVNWSAALVVLDPLAEATVTSTVPALSAGAVAAIELSLVIVKVAAGVAPKLTLVAFVKPVPVIVTEVPPVAGPSAVEIDRTRGTGTNVELHCKYARVELL